MDTSNYAGQIAEIPKELQSTAATQNSESALQSTEGDADEVKIDMNWNIAEQLPEDGNCRGELEAVLKLFMDAVINTNSLASAVEAIPMYAYEIVQRLHKGHAPGKVSPATQFANALVEVLNTVKDVDDEVSKNSNSRDSIKYISCKKNVFQFPYRCKHFGEICYV